MVITAPIEALIVITLPYFIEPLQRLLVQEN